MLTFHSKLGSGRTLLVVVVSVVVVVVMKTLLVAMIRFSFSVFDPLVEKEWYRLCFRQNHRKVVFMRKSRLNGLPRERTEDDKRIIVKLKKKKQYIRLEMFWLNECEWKSFQMVLRESVTRKLHFSQVSYILENLWAIVCFCPSFEK